MEKIVSHFNKFQDVIAFNPRGHEPPEPSQQQQVSVHSTKPPAQFAPQIHRPPPSPGSNILNNLIREQNNQVRILLGVFDTFVLNVFYQMSVPSGMNDFGRPNEVNLSLNSPSAECKCQRDVNELKSRTARLRIKPGIDDNEIEHAIKLQSKERFQRLNDQFQSSVDSYLQVLRNILWMCRGGIG